MKILAIGAHPDDIELQCGGTLAACARQGHEVVMCSATDGSMGVLDESGDAGSVRIGESTAAAAMIGARFMALGFHGPHILREPDPELRAIAAIRAEAPDVIITHADNDYHVNHRETATLIADAIYSCRSVGIQTEAPPLDDLPALFRMDNTAAAGFLPTDYVDITDHMETKLAMLACHQSQLSRLSSHESVEMLEMCRVQNRLRGHQSGVTYAEAFIRDNRWPLTRAASGLLAL
jgi:LmbE family N-acetylglucosaminyl deacetylase